MRMPYAAMDFLSCRHPADRRADLRRDREPIEPVLRVASTHRECDVAAELADWPRASKTTGRQNDQVDRTRGRTSGHSKPAPRARVPGPSGGGVRTAATTLAAIDGVIRIDQL